MKIRTGFVSNSSSSSFICGGLEIDSKEKYIQICDLLNIEFPEDFDDMVDNLYYLYDELTEKYSIKNLHYQQYGSRFGGVIYYGDSIVLDEYDSCTILDMYNIKSIINKCSEINRILHNKVEFNLMYVYSRS